MGLRFWSGTVLATLLCACGGESGSDAADGATPSGATSPPAPAQPPADSGEASTVPEVPAAVTTAEPAAPSTPPMEVTESEPSATSPEMMPATPNQPEPGVPSGEQTSPDPAESAPDAPSPAPSAEPENAGPTPEPDPPQQNPELPVEDPTVGSPLEVELAPVPVARGEHGVAALDGEVYVMCGFTPQVTAAMDVYSPETDSWRAAADVPVVCHHPNVATVDGKLYILGFHSGSGQRVGDGRVFEYDPEQDAWSERAPLPPLTERGASCVTSYDGRAFVFGGTNDIALDYASAYDPQSDTWEELDPLPAYRHHCVAATYQDKIYIVSGRDVVIEEVQPESYVFDPQTQTYEEVAPIPTPRGGSAGGLLGSKIFVFGGEGNQDSPMGIFSDVEAYDILTDSWERLPDMQQPRHGFGGAVIDDRIYLPAGSTRQGIQSQTTLSVFYYDG